MKQVCDTTGQRAYLSSHLATVDEPVDHVHDGHARLQRMPEGDAEAQAFDGDDVGGAAGKSMQSHRMPRSSQAPPRASSSVSSMVSPASCFFSSTLRHSVGGQGAGDFDHHLHGTPSSRSLSELGEGP